MINTIISGVRVCKATKAAKTVEFHIPTAMTGVQFTAWLKANKAAIDAFKGTDDKPVEADNDVSDSSVLA